MALPKYLDWAPKHLSYSSINGYRSCGKRTFLEKVARVESIPGFAAIGGNAVHVATQVIDALILEHGIEALDDIELSELDIVRMIEEA